MKSRPVLLRWLAATVVLSVALVAYAHYTSSPASKRTDKAPNTPGTAALRAAVDPETGELITGPDALRLSGDANKAVDAELAKMLSRSDNGLEAVRYPDGRVGVHLDGRFMNASVARINADGSLETLCTEDPAEAQAFLDAAPEVDALGREVR